jgi:hypothetical protein
MPGLKAALNAGPAGARANHAAMGRLVADWRERVVRRIRAAMQAASFAER